MAAPDTVVSVADKFAAFRDTWAPKIIGRINDLELKAVRIHGEFVWHSHEETDEFFLVHSGQMTIQLAGGDEVTLGAGEFFVVPRGVEHRPVAEKPCEVLLLEPVGVVNTGDAKEREFASEAEWI